MGLCHSRELHTIKVWPGDETLYVEVIGTLFECPLCADHPVWSELLSLISKSNVKALTANIHAELLKFPCAETRWSQQQKFTLYLVNSIINLPPNLKVNLSQLDNYDSFLSLVRNDQLSACATRLGRRNSAKVCIYCYMKHRGYIVSLRPSMSDTVCSEIDLRYYWIKSDHAIEISFSHMWKSNHFRYDTQVAGHDNTFIVSPLNPRNIVKRVSFNEFEFYGQAVKGICSNPASCTKNLIQPGEQDELVMSRDSLDEHGHVMCRDCSVFYREYTPKVYNRFQIEDDYFVEMANYDYGIGRNVIDLKLGTALFAPSASEEKKLRMISKRGSSTSVKCGLRISNCKYWSDPQTYWCGTRQFFSEIESVTHLNSWLNGYMKEVSRELIQSTINKLNTLLVYICDHSGHNFICSSLLIIHDTNTVQLRIIDFAHVVKSGVVDESTLTGIRHLISVLSTNVR